MKKHDMLSLVQLAVSSSSDIGHSWTIDETSRYSEKNGERSAASAIRGTTARENEGHDIDNAYGSGLKAEAKRFVFEMKKETDRHYVRDHGYHRKGEKRYKVQPFVLSNRGTIAKELCRAMRDAYGGAHPTDEWLADAFTSKGPNISEAKLKELREQAPKIAQLLEEYSCIRKPSRLLKSVDLLLLLAPFGMLKLLRNVTDDALEFVRMSQRGIEFRLRRTWLEDHCKSAGH